MEKNKISWARVSKNICYFIAPIFIVLLMACVAGLVIMDTDIDLENTSNYYETKIFSQSYLNSVCSNFYIPSNLSNNTENAKKKKDEAKKKQETYLEESQEKLYEQNSYSIANGYTAQENVDINGKKGMIIYEARNTVNFKYLMIDTKNAVAITNLEHTMKTDTIQEIKDIISQNNIYWNYKNGKIETSIQHLSLEEIRYTGDYQMMQKSGIVESYTSLENDLPYRDDYVLSKYTYDLAMKANTLAPILIPLCIGILLALGLIILNGIGKKGKGPGIYLNGFDDVPLIIAFIISGSIIGLGILCFTFITSEIRAIIFSGAVIGSILIYLGGILLLETIIKRMKTHTLWKTTLLYTIGHALKTLVDNRKITTRLVIFYGGFCFLGFICSFILGREYSYNYEFSFFWYTILVMLGIGTFIALFKKIKQFQTIQNALKAIYEGNTNIELDSNELTGVLKQLAIYIEDIAGGLSNAVQESLKNERLKTELITNVSHDIKTPLTSIINYVDLLKKEKMPNEKATEYLMVLENKSQRLKKLTEDLVEASKASSGNIKLKKEKINVNELIKQVSGEFEDRFKQRGLEEIMTLPEETVFIEADGRYLYRVLENLYSNASKYALENTRVYMDVISKQTSVVIQMKNISMEKLNISADELMQRFVRGEASRNTEGSGLRTFNSI